MYNVNQVLIVLKLEPAVEENIKPVTDIFGFLKMEIFGINFQ